MEEFTLKCLIVYLREMLRHLPSPDLIDEARTLIELYPRAELPDFVEILANGDPDHFDSVREIALADISFEEAEHVQL